LKLTPKNDTEYKLLLRPVSHAYQRRLQEKNKHHHNNHKPKDKNKTKRDDDGDKGSDSKKPRMEMKSCKQIHTDKGIALRAFRIRCWKLEHSVKSESAAEILIQQKAE
jgi:hypothetical protein